MDLWTELINGPLRSEMLQLEMLFQKMIESIPLITVSAIAIFVGLIGLLAVIDRMLLEDQDLPQSCIASVTEKISGQSRDSLSESATRYLRNDTNAAA